MSLSPTIVDQTFQCPREPSLPPSKGEGSIFDSKESAWDEVFKDIKDMPPIPSSNLANGPATTRSRRQAMSAREISAFDEMFSMIFNAVSEQSSSGGAPGSAAVGRAAGGSMSDLFGKLRKHGKKLKWTSESDEELDRKREEMELCDTDQQLLEWAMSELFAESKRYEDAARAAIEKAATADAQDAPIEMPPFQPRWYPYLLSQLIRTFRDKYRDPHLALSIFDHARHLSVPSYVFGCTTPTYNELIETRWRCFRDLRGVVDALEEMTVNVVQADAKTRQLVETMRQEIGAKNVWEEAEVTGNGQVMQLLDRAQQLCTLDAASRRHLVKKKNRLGQQTQSPRDSGNTRWRANKEWKSTPILDKDDDWEFNNWQQ